MKTRFLLALFFIFWSQSAMAIEEPRFTSIFKAGSFEVRQYAPMLVAETVVDGDMDEASTRGFRKIADFIFGNNQSAQTGGSAKIAMTAPVTQEPQLEKSEKIAMTAPVTMGAANNTTDSNTTDSNMAGSNKWRIHFVMPSKYTMANIPQPKNADVKLREIPGKYFAVYNYTGFNTKSQVQAKTDELVAWVREKNLKALSSPQLSRYDPPWTLPMFRRNEIMIEIEEVKSVN
jgi:SOUL heme-binding protein